MMEQHNNNNNNINLNNQKKDPFKLNIATLNVRGLHTLSKQEQLLNYAKLYNVDILGLSETNLPNNLARFTCRSPNHTAYFHNSTSPRGSGVGLILHNSIAHYVRSVSHHGGRILYADLYMKGRSKLRIIQFYNHSSPVGRRADIRDLYHFLTDLLHASFSANFKVILMGDFNISYAKFIKSRQ